MKLNIYIFDLKQFSSKKWTDNILSEHNVFYKNENFQ